MTTVKLDPGKMTTAGSRVTDEVGGSLTDTSAKLGHGMPFTLPSEVRAHVHAIQTRTAATVATRTKPLGADLKTRSAILQQADSMEFVVAGLAAILPPRSFIAGVMHGFEGGIHAIQRFAGGSVPRSIARGTPASTSTQNRVVPQHSGPPKGPTGGYPAASAKPTGEQYEWTWKGSAISERGYYYRNCTDWAAFRLEQMGAKTSMTRGLGNAIEWPGRAGNARTSNVPKVGSAAISSTLSGYGHVGVVEEVRPDGTIVVSEYNRNCAGEYSIQTGTPKALGYQKFVDMGI